MSYPTNQPIRHRGKSILIKLYFSHFSSELFANTNMAGFSFDSGGRRCIRPILEKYQSGIWGTNKRHDIEINYILNIFWSIPKTEESEGYTVKSKEKSFPVSIYPLMQSEFFYAHLQARDKLPDEKNKQFDYSKFRFRNGNT